MESMLFYFLEHCYVFARLFLFFNRNRRVLFLLPAFLCMGLFPLVFLLLPEGPAQQLFSRVGIVWLPSVFFLFLAFLATDLLATTLRVTRRFGVRRALPAPRGLWWGTFLFACAIAYGYGLYEARTLTVTRLEIATDKLPASRDRLRVVFASDLHINPHTGIAMLRKAVDTINGQNADIILLGGDILDDGWQGTREDFALLTALRAPLGVFGVLGNHDARVDAARARDVLAGSGIQMLAEESVDVGPVRIIGMDDPVAYKLKGGDDQDAEFVSLVTKSNAQKPKPFIIVMEHKPILRRDQVGLYDIQVSGHTHGGQIFLISPQVHAKYGIEPGMNRLRGPNGDSLFYVTNGTGFSKLPIRLLAPPEIVVIDVVREPGRQGSTSEASP